jgi:alanine racemase
MGGLGRQHPAALHVDTGMTRLGLAMEEAESLARDQATVAALNLALVMSHLACADEPAHALNAQQITGFDRVRALLPGVPGSLANSAGTLQGDRFKHDLARPGIAIYGGEAVSAPQAPDQVTTLRPVIHLQARILQVRHARAGETVGYGARQTLQRDSRIAILGVGYADGYHRIAGSTDEVQGAFIALNGSLAPFAGRISMDLIAADITEPAFAALKAGDWIDLINAHYTVNHVAKAAQTIGYEVLTGLGERYTRTYRSDI